MQIAIVIICILVIVVGFMYQWSLFATRAPFVEIPKEVLDDIVKAMDVGPGDVVYDLGSGDGRVLEACYHRRPEARYIGIDKALVPNVVAKWRLRKIPKGKIELLHKNFFKYDLSGATCVYVYLFPGLLKSLLPKLQRELKLGARIVSCDFEFEGVEPIEVVDLKRPKGKRGRRLYVYELK
ncbi:hypothetical protein GF391_03345 [Candidatus Uhrbacteria bacterium]|nr:hypothetical protein [Candidatus Uhrbacteria bacterium]